MKCLFASCYGTDYLASTVWHGLRELLGPENVFDAQDGARSLQIVGGHAERLMGAEIDFDLLVLNACFLRDNSVNPWNWVAGHLGVEQKGRPGDRLLPTSKIIYIEGWDGAWDVNPPHVPVDAVFRREIDPNYSYPYVCYPLQFAVPEYVFETDDHERPFDVCYMANLKDIGIRWEVWDRVNNLQKKIIRYLSHRSPEGAVNHGTYLRMLRQSKLCICPPGAGSDCLRQWEAIALGSIPVFVGHPPRKLTPPWFDDDEILWCDTVAELPESIEYALTTDLDARRRKLQAHALAEHTTRARAKRILKLSGLT